MDVTPNTHRLKQLRIGGFSMGAKILFCPDCPWQALEPCGMKKVCPDCRAQLHVSTKTDDLVRLCRAHWDVMMLGADY